MPFTPGLSLCAAFYHQAVRPILDDAVPGLRYAAALIGPGSEVLGFDTEISADHHWGPRVMLFLDEPDLHAHADHIFITLAERLPLTFGGYPTNFSPPVEANGTRLMQPVQHGPVAHRVETLSVPAFWQDYLGLPPWVEPGLLDWLTLEEHRLRAVTGGALFRDGLQPSLQAARDRLGYYPRDVWLYLLAAQWSKIGQEEPFVGRTGSVGDELGSAVIAARLAGALMRLCFLMERQYAPYSKWFGTAFARLACAAEMMPPLRAALAAPGWEQREAALCRALEVAARMHNRLGLTPPQPERVSPFHGRPFNVIHGEQFAEALAAQISDPRVRALPPNAGSINQWVESVDVLDDVKLCGRLRGLYG